MNFRRTVLGVVAAMLSAGGCAGEDAGIVEGVAFGGPHDDGDPDLAHGADDDGELDLAHGADDVLPCTEDELGADELTFFVTAHRVVDGVLTDVCFGSVDPDLEDAWEALVTVTPPGQLADLALFSGFESGEDGAEVTLAWVAPIDADGSQFHMAVNLPEYAAYPDEALLTIAHEFAHVFNGVGSQLDRSVESLDNCPTYDNGDGCYRDDSLMWAWIQEFWSEDELVQVDPLTDATSADGQDRCERDAGFFGPYAASNPDEDFAESFSAFVFDAPAATPEQRNRLDWMAAQPGLAEFRDRAEAAGLTPIPNEFEVCG